MSNSTPQIWDTLGLLEQLLGDFPGLMAQSLRLNVRGADSLSAESVAAIKLAIIGYSLFNHPSEWGKWHTEIMEERLNGQFSPQELEWHEEAAGAVALFSSLALGALLGKADRGEIDNSGFARGDFTLASFVLMNSKKIHEHYLAAER